MSLAVPMRPFHVAARRALTETIAEFTLTPADGGEIATFTAGSHVTVETPSGAMRRYSLVNEGEVPDSLVIAVKREPQSRGGSASMHGEAQPGTILNVSAPQNNFALQSAPRYLLIAGGIGITPILAMGQHLRAIGKPFDLIYCTRSVADTAYLDAVRALGHRVTIHHDNGDPHQLYDFWDHFETPSSAQVYCCGPAPLMEEIKAVSGHWPEGRVHFEDFKGIDAVRPSDQPFRVSLHGTGQVVDVAASKSILEALRDAGIRVASSCESGTCGTCRCRLISGRADHRDMVLMEEEKDSQIMICVSRAQSGDLTSAL